MPAITPMIWYDGTAEAAMNLYVSVFPNSRVDRVVRCGEAGPGPIGSVLVCEFTLDGQPFSALNGGPAFPLTEACSFVIFCDTQAEVDHYWDKLLADGGTPSRCGWLKDRYGLSWQVTPRVLMQNIGHPDPATAARVMQAMMAMAKIDIAQIEAAVRGEHPGGV
jgi:predicted 3-demethylubiquinone-9 3-methyltransferase (glyoxalase superfamily)